LGANWFDLNKNGIMETTDDYELLWRPFEEGEFDLDSYRDPNITSPYTDEIVVGVERELGKDFSLSIAYIYKNKKRMTDDVEKYRGYTPDSPWWVPTTVAEPGFDGEFGTGDDQQLTVYGVKNGAPISHLWSTNPEGLKRVYNAVELVLQKRFSDRWQFLGSLTWSKLTGTRDGHYAMDYGNSFDTPNWLVNRDGRTLLDRPIVIKMQGSVLLPYDFMLSAYFFLSSGTPWTRTIQVQLPNDAGTYEYPGTWVETVNADQAGSQRYKSRSNLDIRLEKSFTLGNVGTLGIFADVMNAFGESGYEIDQDPGGRLYNDGTFERWPNYGRHTGIYGLRTIRLSLRFNF
jgi:hypothetical protein